MTDIQERFRDYEFCSICKRDVPDNQIRTVTVIEDDRNFTKRICSMCNDCYYKCEVDKKFEKEVTDYVFKK